MDPDAGVQAPAVTPDTPGEGVAHVATAPAGLVAVTVRFEGTSTVSVKIAPATVAPVRLARRFTVGPPLGNTNCTTSTAPVRFASDRLALVRLVRASWVSLRLAASRVAPKKFAKTRIPPTEVSSGQIAFSTSAPILADVVGVATKRAPKVAPERSACVRFAPLRSTAAHDPLGHCANVSPARFAYDRLNPEKLRPEKFTFGQSVKSVVVGFETIVQPLMTVSAAAGVAVAVAKTGATRTTAIANAVPVTRRIRPTITVTPICATPILRLALAVLPVEWSHPSRPQQ